MILAPLFAALAIAPATTVVVAGPVAIAAPDGARPDGAALKRTGDALERALRARGLVTITDDGAPRYTSPERVIELRTRAEAAVEAADYGGAIRVYGELVDELVKELARVDPQVLISAHLERARLYAGAGEAELQQRSFDAAARLKPTLELDPRKFPPQAIEAFQRARDRVAAEAKATVELRLQPTGARVLVDGVGAAAGALTLAAGPHQVWVTAPGYLPAGRTITVTAGERATLEVTLDPHPARTARLALEDAVGAGATVGAARQQSEVLRREASVEAVVVSGLAVVGGELLWTARTFGGGGETGALRVPGDLSGLDDAAGRIAAALAGASPLPAVSGKDAHADFERSAAGIHFGARKTRVVDAPGPEDEPSAWPWIAVGAVVVAAAAAGGVALLVPGEPLPDVVNVSVEVAR
jgi:hypothetical protein